MRVLEKLVSVDVDGGKEATAAEVQVEVVTNVPQPEVRLRLWTPQGREPRPARPVAPMRWALDDVRRGSTLTWLVRLASPDHDHFELTLQVFQGKRPLPGARFSYSGPLDGLEERSGRFHFTAS